VIAPAASDTRAVAVIDGEHYAPVVREALAEVPYDVVAAVLVGGTEKLREGADYGVPLAAGIDEAIAEYAPELVLDLSDEPVLGPVERMRLASSVLAHGLPYAGSDFRFEAPAFADFALPSLAVVGTGKRVGKTAVTGHVARILARDRRVVVVAMGRGGPAQPEVIASAPTVQELLALSRAGRHAASDHLETAALAGVETVGCRRCGGGLAGAVAVSNVAEGARIAAGLGPDLVVFDGSGAALPPVRARRRIVVVGAHQDPAVATGYLNAYRHLLADLVVVTMAEDGGAHAPLVDALRALVRPGVPVVPTVLRPRPMTSVTGRTVAYFGTAPRSAHARIAAHLREAHGAEVVHVSGGLANRSALRSELPHVQADIFVVELKAAAVDVVAEEAAARGIELVLAANDVVARPGPHDLDRELRRLADEATEGEEAG
jgi:cyclic 2,3-diphosphoglycerate synthetase